MAYWAMNNGEMGLTYEVSGLDGITADGSPLEIAAGTDVSNLTLTNTSALPLWVTQTAHGAPASVPAPAAQGLSLTKTLYSPSGQALTQGQFRQGDRVVVEITLQSTEERIVPAIVEDLLPAGFEIEAVLRPADGAPNGTYRWLGAIDNPKTAEKRDDRFVAAIDLRSKQSVRLAYVVRAITPGQFTLPAVYAEDMYRPNVFARTEVNEIRIAP